MAAIAMVTKVQKMLNSLQISQIFAVVLPVTPTSTISVWRVICYDHFYEV
jgi:hypothetical protein